MSAFFAKCPDCGTVYFHCFVGTTLYSGHVCEKPSPYSRELDEIHADLAELQRRTFEHAWDGDA